MDTSLKRKVIIIGVTCSSVILVITLYVIGYALYVFHGSKPQSAYYEWNRTESDSILPEHKFATASLAYKRTTPLSESDFPGKTDYRTEYIIMLSDTDFSFINDSYSWRLSDNAIEIDIPNRNHTDYPESIMTYYCCDVNSFSTESERPIGSTIYMSKLWKVLYIPYSK